MSRVSLGILYSAQEFLAMASNDELTIPKFQEKFSANHTVHPDHIMQISRSCGWIEVDALGILRVTTSGQLITAAGLAESQLRVQLQDFIFRMDPPWAKRLQHGRVEAVRTMPEEVKQAFREAGLLADLTEEIVSWWDRLSLAVRGAKQEGNLAIGRRAERLSMVHEGTRTLVTPKWQCMESNFSGFDILSIKSKTDTSPLRIEVKGSSQPKPDAFFYLTRNEWDVAKTSGDYCFHLWLMRGTDELATVDFKTVANHVSIDQGDGKWDNIKIPFAPFF